MDITVALEIGKTINGVLKKYSKSNKIAKKLEFDISNLIKKYTDKPNFKFLEKIKENDVLENFIDESMKSPDLFCKSAIDNVGKKIKIQEIDSLKIFLDELSEIMVIVRAEFASENEKDNYKFIQKLLHNSNIELKAKIDDLNIDLKDIVESMRTPPCNTRKKNPRPIVNEISDEDYEKLSIKEQETWIKDTLERDPQGAFLDMAISAFEEGNIEDFDFLAGMAVQYSDDSLLTEIAMTLLKTMLILKKKEPQYAKLSDDLVLDIENTTKNHYYIRLHALTTLIIELIEEERNGKFSIGNDFENSSRSLLHSFIDFAASNDTDKGKKKKRKGHK